MADEEITVWLNAYRLKALEEQMELEGSSVEKHLQDYLIDLYSEMVPFEEQQRIQNTIDKERRQAEEEAEANRRFSVFRVREHGEETLFLADGDMDMLVTAVSLRDYVRNSSKISGFQNMFPKSQPIKEQQFQDAVNERMDNTGRVVGAYEVDMDKGEFSALNIMDGWMVFRIKDVSTAAYKALLKNWIDWSDRLDRFLSALDGKELTDIPMIAEVKGTRRLKPEEICFRDEVIECDGKLSFYMPVIFSTWKVFGNQVAAMENINVYANYDIARQRTDNALEIIGFSDEAQDRRYRYLLTNDEREVLTEKMAAYCQK